MLFIKIRLKQRISDTQSQETSQSLPSQSFLDFIDSLSLQIPAEEWEKLPSDLSKNVDHYLYG